ncbi:MAG: ribosome biogenesis GTPase Der [Gammaproteobacteria bacterium]|nr:ribosome biogenesis GTPase Der [Gammaproteobacteria bacterium]MDE2345634.1 ribosome biogenesis GTPase Der [Gammaproteobacteria bacterium]
MLPVIAIIGRPNVGKSTLFNLLTRSRDALVADLPGFTRDRQYGFGRLGSRPYVAVDTGGLDGSSEGLPGEMAKQTLRAFAECQAAILMVDGRSGLNAVDQEIAARLRRAGKPIYVAVNKTEGMAADVVTGEFHALGLGQPHAISAAHGSGVDTLIESVLAGLPADVEAPATDERRIHVAVVGRPNVGKSTLINRLLGEERLITFDQPGTTRDSIYVPFDRDAQAYMLIDTAGIRRRARVSDKFEKFSIVKTLQAVDQAQVVIVMLDAREGVTDQDASLLGLVMQRGRALVLAVNKWDGLEDNQRENVRRLIDVKLPFLEFARLHFISALHGSGVGELMQSVKRAYTAATRQLSTPELTRVLEAAVAQHQPPLVRGRRIRLRYAHQGGRNPPVIVVHGNQTSAVPDAYRRYLEGVFREAFDLYGTPVHIEFRSGENPYAQRRKKQTPKQAKVARRQRRIARGRKHKQ